MLDLAGDTLQLAESLEIKSPKTIIRNAESLQALQSLHDRWVCRLNDRLAEKYRPPEDEPEFEIFPYKDSDTIKAIRTESELVVEGRLMRHCIVSYVPHIPNNRYCVYRVLAPERATVGFRLDKDGKPQLDQLQGRFNRKVQPETDAAVAQWMMNQSSLVQK